LRSANKDTSYPSRKDSIKICIRGNVADEVDSGEAQDHPESKNMVELISLYGKPLKMQYPLIVKDIERTCEVAPHAIEVSEDKG